MLVNMVDSENNFQNKIFPYILSQLSIEEYDELKSIFKNEEEYLNERKHLTSLMLESPNIIYKEIKELRDKIEYTEQSGFRLQIQEFEIANILRLGLMRQLPPKILIHEFSTGAHSDFGIRQEWHQLDAEYSPDDFGYRITELGEKFIAICELKREG